MDIAYLIFSVLFFAVAGISVFLGAFALYLDAKSAANKAFAAVCFSLFIWSFGFSIAVYAPDTEACLFWRRLSAVGWGSIFSIILHYFLILTGSKAILKKWWIYILLYFPVVLNICAFSLPINLNPDQYNFVRTNLGWINVATNSAWDVYFAIYCLACMVLGLGLIRHWGRHSVEEYDKKKSGLIFWSFLIAAVAGTLTDIVFNVCIMGLNPSPLGETFRSTPE